ncbi:MAG: hypothetical protein HXX16_12495 [Bacteroidales bacterium]|nr:hypothetical protein [Bacteroidales bacterium]
MRKIFLLPTFVFAILFSKAQPTEKIINDYLLKYQLYPLNLPEILSEPPILGEVENIEITTNDTITYQINLKGKRLKFSSHSNSQSNFFYRFGKLSKIEYVRNDSIIDRVRKIGIFPFAWIFNHGLKYTVSYGFGNIKKIKSLTGLTTFSKTKIKYKNGRVKKTKNYGWQTVAQKCNYFGYNTYTYENETKVVEKVFDANDSLAFNRTYLFDNKGNILSIETLIKKKAKGWGIDVTYYAYDGNTIETRKFDYKFDDRGNWLEKTEYLDDKVKNRTIRKIRYKN